VYGFARADGQCVRPYELRTVKEEGSERNVDDESHKEKNLSNERKGGNDDVRDIGVEFGRIQCDTPSFMLARPTSFLAPRLRAR
jgi:hypothetical protein